MKAMVMETYGDAELFTLYDMPRPEVIPGHVLIHVKATSVNPVDCRIREGLASGLAPALPAVLHGDVAGVVVGVGSGVTAFRVGDEVYGLAGGTKGTAGGALAEYMLADASLLARKPRNVSMKEAAALPLVALTAWQALVERGKIESGQTVLVHAAAGGVGHIGIQLAKWFGARVFTTAATPEKEALGIELGATDVINYRRQTVAEYVAEYTGGKGFDLVFDTVGGANLEKSFEAVKPLGTVVAIATRETHDLSLMNFKGLTLHVVYCMYPLVSGVGRAHYGEILQQITQLVEAKQLRPVLDSHLFSFAEVSAAHRLLESGQNFGKVALENTWY